MATKRKNAKRSTSRRKRASFGEPPVITPQEPEEEVEETDASQEPIVETEPADETPAVASPIPTETAPPDTTEPLGDFDSNESVNDSEATTEADNDQTAAQLEPLSQDTQASPEPAERSFSWANFLVGLLIGVAISVGAGAAWWYYQAKTAQMAEETKMAEVTPTPTETPTPTPTPTPAAMDAYSITVLNGSGVSGAAARLKSSLEEQGYTVADTGNADSSTNTFITAGEDVDKAWISDLETYLGKTYTMGDTVTSSSNPNSVEITIGSE